MLQYIKEKLKANKYTVVLPAIVFSLISNMLLITKGYGCPDNLCEGAVYYTGSNWALEIGRWAIRYLNASTGYVVIPALNILVSVLCCCVTCILLANLWNIHNGMCLAIASVSLTVAPAITGQFLYIYMDLAYSWSLVLSTVSAYLVLTGNNRRLYGVLASICLGLALGGYQSYVGFTAAIILLTVIFRLLNGLHWKQALFQLGHATLMGIGGGVIYIVLLKINQAVFHSTLSSYSGADKIGLGNTIKHLPSSIVNMYQVFFQYYLDDTANRATFFCPLLALLLLVLCYKFYRLIDSKHYLSVALTMLCCIALPIAMNVIVLIAPERGISVLMSHQMQLLIPFSLALVDTGGSSVQLWKKASFICGTLFSSLVCLSCCVYAYATQYSIEYMYRYMQTYATGILVRLQTVKGYSEKTKIMFLGIPDENAVQQNNPIYEFGMKSVSVFWNGEYGVLTCWPKYMQNYMAIDTGSFTADEYHRVLDSNQFAEMPCYPEEGSIQYFEDFFIVKIEDDPPRN